MKFLLAGDHHPYCVFRWERYMNGSKIHGWACVCAVVREYDAWKTGKPWPPKARTKPLPPKD